MAGEKVCRWKSHRWELVCKFVAARLRSLSSQKTTTTAGPSWSRDSSRALWVADSSRHPARELQCPGVLREAFQIYEWWTRSSSMVLAITFGLAA